MSRSPSKYSSGYDTGHSTRHVDSNWWQLIALAGAFFVVSWVAAVVLFFWILVGFLFGVAGGPLELLFGSIGLVFVLVLLLALFGLVLGLLLPVALYFDAEAVNAANVGWSPDPTLYVGVGVLGLFAQGVPLQAGVAFYYLYKRHEAVGTP